MLDTNSEGDIAMDRFRQSEESNATFYHLNEQSLTYPRSCQGLACFAARHADPIRWTKALAEPNRLYCLGKCYCGPATTESDLRPRIESHTRKTVLLNNILVGGVHTFNQYVQRGGGSALALALSMSQHELVDRITRSGLRGRGGAGFPAGRKWHAVAHTPGPVKYIVANADEGDPGSFSDRYLLEDDPFLLIEAMAIAAYAVGAGRGYIYLRKEYPIAYGRLQTALNAARTGGWLGDRVFGGESGFDIELVLGQGSYLCGEETAMLNAIENRRPEARTRPPHIFEHGLFGAPTLVQNVETLCAVPWIINQGASAYAALGFSASRGTKLISLPSLFKSPGLYEVEFGITLREIIDVIGAGLHGGELRALMVGGPLAGLIPPPLLDTRFGYEELQAIGAAVGHGGVIAFTQETTVAEIAHEVFRFGAYESCGKCVPCHRGSPLLEKLFETATRGARTTLDPVRYADVVAALEAASLCGHGRGLAEFANSLQRYFHEDLAACFV